MDISDEREEEVFRDFIDKMEEAARKLGLYLNRATGQRQPVDRMVPVGVSVPVRPLVAATFTLGDEAFSDRVQHPERYTDDAMLAGIEEATWRDAARRISEGEGWMDE